MSALKTRKVCKEKLPSGLIYTKRVTKTKSMPTHLLLQNDRLTKRCFEFLLLSTNYYSIVSAICSSGRQNLEH